MHELFSGEIGVLLEILIEIVHDFISDSIVFILIRLCGESFFLLQRGLMVQVFLLVLLEDGFRGAEELEDGDHAFRIILLELLDLNVGVCDEWEDLIVELWGVERDDTFDYFHDERATLCLLEFCLDLTAGDSIDRGGLLLSFIVVQGEVSLLWSLLLLTRVEHGERDFHELYHELMQRFVVEEAVDDR